MKKSAGFIILAIVFSGFVAATALDLGWINALIVWAVAILLIGIIYLAIKLMVE